MRVPLRRDKEAMRVKRRTLDRIERDAAAQRAQLTMPPSLAALRSPRVLLPVLLGLVALGGLLITAAGKVHGPSVTQIPHVVALRELNVLATALGRYRFHVGTYPTNSLGLKALREYDGMPGWNGPYINNIRPDPWKRAYGYQLVSNDQARVFSVGPDGRSGTPDDLQPDPAAYNVGTAWTNGWVPAVDRLPGVRIVPHH
jgi:type II secretion system protein G